MRSNPLERATSLVLSTALHAAAGLAFMLQPRPDGAQAGEAARSKGGMVVVSLVSASPDGGARPASAAPSPRTALTETQPRQIVAARSAAPATAAKADERPGEAANLGTASGVKEGGASASSLTGTSAITYRDVLLAHIARFRRYPEEALRGRLEGSADVGFTLARSGEVERVWLVSSSGRPVFDQEAVAAVRRAAPMPAIPADLPASLDITLPIDFDIE